MKLIRSVAQGHAFTGHVPGTENALLLQGPKLAAKRPPGRLGDAIRLHQSRFDTAKVFGLKHCPFRSGNRPFWQFWQKPTALAMVLLTFVPGLRYGGFTIYKPEAANGRENLKGPYSG